MPSLSERYRELETLGQGGMGQVFRGHDPHLKRDVAIKCLHPDDGQDEQARSRFLREAESTGQLEHPNIPPIYELAEDDQGRPYFALKLVRGKSLRQLIEGLNQGDSTLLASYPFSHRLSVFAKVCEAVAYAHQRGVLHRDIKPDNIMVGEFGEVFLIDWGLAESAAGDQSGEDSFEGTPMYAAPERITGTPADARSDVYALGATLYEWLTLRPPFSGKTIGDLLQAVLTQSPQNPVMLNHPVQGRIPVEMSRFIQKCMARDPQKRYPSAREMLLDIQDMLDGDIRPVCPCTTVKFGFHTVRNWIDRYPILSILVLAWLLYPLYALLQALYQWIRT